MLGGIAPLRIPLGSLVAVASERARGSASAYRGSIVRGPVGCGKRFNASLVWLVSLRWSAMHGHRPTVSGLYPPPPPRPARVACTDAMTCSAMLNPRPTRTSTTTTSPEVSRYPLPVRTSTVVIAVARSVQSWRITGLLPSGCMSQAARRDDFLPLLAPRPRTPHPKLRPVKLCRNTLLRAHFPLHCTSMHGNGDLACITLSGGDDQTG
jgi:hypothetical protein